MHWKCSTVLDFTVSELCGKKVEAKTKMECNNIRSILHSAESSRDKREETKKKVKYTVVRLCSTTKQSEAKRRVW